MLLTVLGIYLIGFIFSYIIIRFISEQSLNWGQVREKLLVSSFSWITVFIFGCVFVNELISDAIWEYRYKHPKKPKKKREPINPPKWL